MDEDRDQRRVLRQLVDDAVEARARQALDFGLHAAARQGVGDRPASGVDGPGLGLGGQRRGAGVGAPVVQDVGDVDDGAAADPLGDAQDEVPVLRPVELAAKPAELVNQVAADGR